MFNLHTHSTASDGAIQPEVLPAMALQEGLTGIALTDHDTTEGIAAFLRAGESCASLQCIPGVELSCEPPTGGEIHLVGLFIDPQNDSLQAVLRQIRVWRQERNAQILQKLAELDMPLEEKDIPKGNTPDEVLGRPHIAQALVQKRYCKSFDQAFERFLRRGRPAYTPRKKLSVYDAIDVVHQAGGTAIWAHPLSRHITQHKFHDLLEDFRKHGLDAVEAWHPDHTEREVKTIIAFAKEFGLSLSGGTDFHGNGSHAGYTLASVGGKPFPLPQKLPHRIL